MVTNALLINNQLNQLFKGAIIFKNPDSVNNFLKLNHYQSIDQNQLWSTDDHNHLSQAANKYFNADLLVNFVHFDQDKTKQLVFSLIIKDKIIEHTIDLSKYQLDNYIHPVSMIVLNNLVEELVAYHEIN
ncbi:hypothetical protein [[Mycoplasma] imitans]|uniref:hypothetical protein n=1 Tax=[Mycoplasma] imitans TaxID=29560 RepID=UPI001FE118B2|nr:hypothetical protein [[Mycoplasma] imitans]